MVSGGRRHSDTEQDYYSIEGWFWHFTFWLGKFPNFSEPLFPHLPNRMIKLQRLIFGSIFKQRATSQKMLHQITCPVPPVPHYLPWLCRSTRFSSPIRGKCSILLRLRCLQKLSKSVLYTQLIVPLLISSLRFENCPLSKASPRKGSYGFKGATLVFIPVEQFYLLQNSHHISPHLSHRKDIVFFKDPPSENQLVCFTLGHPDHIHHFFRPLKIYAFNSLKSISAFSSEAAFPGGIHGLQSSFS